MFKDKQVIHMVCVGKNFEIGKNNKLLFSVPEDLQFFKNTTIGNSLVMGRMTFDSIPNGLPRRIVSKVSRKGWSDFVSDGVILYAIMCNASLKSELLNTKSIYVVGGNTIYKQTEDIVDQLIITHVDSSDEDADTFYDIPQGFVEVGTLVKTTVSSSGLTYCIKKYERE